MLTLALSLSLSLMVQDPPQSAPAETPTRLEDVVVVGQPLEAMINGFVDQVSAPARARGLARWRGGVCVGVANLQGDTAGYLVDRISDVARDLGLTAGEPGCDPTILIVATVNAAEYTRRMAAARPWVFRAGGSGMDRGGNAFQDFLNTDRPVRWWAVSYPVDVDTGQRATRLPGEVNGAGVDSAGGTGGMGPYDYAPVLNLTSASRLRTEIVDDLSRIYVVVDVDKLEGTTIRQLADYVAMVSLAQVDPKADTHRYATILNLFDDPGSAAELTDWDIAYLHGLYGAGRTLSDHASYLSDVADSIARAHARLRADPAP